MSPEEEDDIIRREFKKRNKRTTEQVLLDIEKRLTRPSGWCPPRATIVYKAKKLRVMK